MRKLLMLLTALLVLACNNEGEYSTWPCRFAYDNSLHLDPNLSSAMNANARGVFCKIWESSLGGRALNFQNNQGLQTTSQPETALEKEANFVLGINNGIIVGFQTFNDYPNGGFVAYDVQCPNCVRRDPPPLPPDEIEMPSSIQCFSTASYKSSNVSF